jgi:RND family efflux transporter MFP subunit
VSTFSPRKRLIGSHARFSVSLPHPFHLLLALVVLAMLACVMAPASVVRAQDAGIPAQKQVQDGGRAGPKPGQALPVIVATVVEEQDVAAVEVIGSGLALRSVTLYPASAGEVVDVAFQAGQAVRAGQVLLRLEDRRQRLAVDMASAKLDAARRLLARYERTGTTGAVAGSVLDQARNDLRQAEIALAQAQEALADRTLRAPFAGVVGLAEVQPGDRITTETVVTTLDDRSRIRVAFSVPEAYLGRLAIGHDLTVSNVAYPDRRFEGRLSRIDSRVDAVTRQVRVEAVVRNGDDLLRPGMSFKVDLRFPGGRFISVPALALQWDREGAHVWAVRDHKAERVPVRMVRRLQTHVLLEGALRQGEAVVVEGVQRLRSGRPVQIIGSEDSARTAEGNAR